VDFKSADKLSVFIIDKCRFVVGLDGDRLLFRDFGPCVIICMNECYLL
jgi:hypothetical protein